VAVECERWQWRELVASEHGPADPSTRLVLFVLALHMNQSGDNAFPSQATIARRAGLSERSVRTHLGLAENGGWIKVFNKPRKGQAWFVHEYLATIPDELAQFCTSKPWEDDPTWQRAENSAGRPSNGVDKSSVNGRHPAILAGHPAILAQRPANASGTPGKFCRNARQGLPTNSSSNSSMNPSINTPMEGAALERITGSKTVNKTGLKEKPEEKKASKEERIRKAIQGFKDFGDGDIAKIARVSVAEVAEIRRQA